MRSITIQFPDAEERRREPRRGAAAVVVLVAAGAFGGWAISQQQTAAPVTQTDTRTTTTTTDTSATTGTTQTTGTTAATDTTATTSTTTQPPPSPAKLDANPTRLDFAPLSDGAVPHAQFVRIRNTGNAPLSIAAPVIRGTSFHVSSNCPPQLARSERCSLAVVFDPNAGSGRGTLTIRTDGGTADIPLIGTARPLPPIELQPLDFGGQIVNVAGEPHNIKLTNGRPMLLALGGSSARPPFNVVKDGCSHARLPPGGGCDVLVDFDPTAAGQYDSELSISGADGRPAARAALHGAGLPQPPVKLVFDPPRIDFGFGPRQKNITVRNPGPRPVKISKVAMSPEGGAFDIKTDCLKTLDVNAPPCHIQVTEKAIRGLALAKIVVTYDGGEDAAGLTSHPGIVSNPK